MRIVWACGIPTSNSALMSKPGDRASSVVSARGLRPIKWEITKSRTLICHRSVSRKKVRNVESLEEAGKGDTTQLLITYGRSTRNLAWIK